MLYSYNIYCYFPMVKESLVSGAKLVLEYCERNSKRYVGKHTWANQSLQPNRTNILFSFKDRFLGHDQRCLCKGHHLRRTDSIISSKEESYGNVQP